MTTRDVPLPRALSIDEHEELRKQLCWITTAIDRIESELDSPAVRITFNDAPTDDLVAEITSAAARIVSVFEHLPEKILHETTTRPTCACATAYDDLVDRGDVRPMGEGLHNYGGVTARLFSALAATFRRTARSLGAEELHFPTLIRMETLHRTGYLRGFPQHCQFVSNIEGNAEELRAFRDHIASCDGPGTHDVRDFQVNPQLALTPAVCYHAYEHVAGRQLTDDSILVTAAQPCYRNEGQATEGLRRLREFTMREVICIGTEAAVMAKRDRMLEAMKSLMDRMAISGSIVSATDPFFLDDYDAKRLFQIGFDLKHELRATMPGAASLAIASLNYHQDHFGRAFEITTPDGEAAHSCCIGFGFDRWCATIFAQHGIEPVDWPEPLRRLMAESLS